MSTGSRVDRLMEAALRGDVEECEQAVREATPRPVVSKGKLIMAKSNFTLEVAQRQLAVAQRRLEDWLEEHK